MEERGRPVKEKKTIKEGGWRGKKSKNEHRMIKRDRRKEIREGAERRKEGGG